jgi:hypothetical protein
MLSTLALAAAALASAPAPSAANDICMAMVPPKLQAALTQAHTDYVLPRLTDAPVSRLVEIAESGAWPCPFVVIGDFDGDDRLDRALLLRHRDSSAARLITARNLASGWQADLQEDWPIEIASAGIEPLEPGLYEQTQSGDAAANLDNLLSIQSDHAGFLVGQLDKPRRSYFFVETQWRSIVLEDRS